MFLWLFLYLKEKGFSIKKHVDDLFRLDSYNNLSEVYYMFICLNDLDLLTPQRIERIVTLNDSTLLNENLTVLCKNRPDVIKVFIDSFITLAHEEKLISNYSEWAYSVGYYGDKRIAALDVLVKLLDKKYFFGAVTASTIYSEPQNISAIINFLDKKALLTKDNIDQLTENNENKLALRKFLVWIMRLSNSNMGLLKGPCDSDVSIHFQETFTQAVLDQLIEFTKKPTKTYYNKSLTYTDAECDFYTFVKRIENDKLIATEAFLTEFNATLDRLASYGISVNEQHNKAMSDCTVEFPNGFREIPISSNNLQFFKVLIDAFFRKKLLSQEMFENFCQKKNYTLLHILSATIQRSGESGDDTLWQKEHFDIPSLPESKIINSISIMNVLSKFVLKQLMNLSIDKQLLAINYYLYSPGVHELLESGRIKKENIDKLTFIQTIVLNNQLVSGILNHIDDVKWQMILNLTFKDWIRLENYVVGCHDAGSYYSIYVDTFFISLSTLKAQEKITGNDIQRLTFEQIVALENPIIWRLLNLSDDRITWKKAIKLSLEDCIELVKFYGKILSSTSFNYQRTDVAVLKQLEYLFSNNTPQLTLPTYLTLRQKKRKERDSLYEIRKNVAVLCDCFKFLPDNLIIYIAMMTGTHSEKNATDIARFQVYELENTPSAARLIREHGLWREAELNATEGARSNGHSQALVVWSGRAT